MKIGLKPTGAAEMALRLMARRGRGDWTVLVVEHASDIPAVAEELAEEMESISGEDVERINIVRDAPDLATRLVASPRPAVVAGLDSWGDDEWSLMDHLRSRLSRGERTALVVSRPTFESIMRAAPNFSSWLGASAWTYAPRAAELTEEEQARRLETLRAWSGLTDAEVIARAERGALPGDPEFAEWLVLLHREDLLGR